MILLAVEQNMVARQRRQAGWSAGRIYDLTKSSITNIISFI
jgi:hypothetical protein